MTLLSIFSILGLLIASLGFLSVFIITLLVTRLRLGEIPPHKHDLNSLVLFILCTIWVVFCVWYIITPEIIVFLGLFTFLQEIWFQIIGLFCLSGLVILLAAFFEMDNSFRMGIPPDDEPSAAVITTGIFRYTRNPGFLGIDLAVFGTFLLVPTVFFGLLIILACIFFHFQIKKEEKYLLQKHGEAYKRYFQKTGRYIPKLIK
ncbi:MAG: methyltransferase family protein [Candidatus Hermodarchaeota archaeon]